MLWWRSCRSDSDPNNIAATQAEYERLAACGAMLAAEGPNEPNNFKFNYKGKTCSTHGSFLPCAQYMAAEYAMVKGDPELARMQVWDQTEPGAEPDNVGIQFLTVPSGQGTIELAGTVFADVANLHNYVMGNGQKTIADNQAWNAESTAGGPWDGLVGEYCNTTWKGYAATPLASCTMPKVTTEPAGRALALRGSTGQAHNECIPIGREARLAEHFSLPFVRRASGGQRWLGLLQPERRHGQGPAEAIGNLYPQHDDDPQ